MKSLSVGGAGYNCVKQHHKTAGTVIRDISFDIWETVGETLKYKKGLSWIKQLGLFIRDISFDIWKTVGETLKKKKDFYE